MKKDKKNKPAKKKFIQKSMRADNMTEYVIQQSPTKTWWGKLILIIILVGFVALPVLGLIFLLTK